MGGQRVDGDGGADGWLDGFRKRSTVGVWTDTRKSKQEIIEPSWRKAGATNHQEIKSDLCTKMLSAMLRKMLGRQAHKANLKT